MCAPKGNKYAEGNNGGRPMIYTDPNKLLHLVLDYFKWIEGESEEIEVEYTDPKTKEKTKKKVQRWVRRPEPPTVTGLSLHVGFSGKSTLYEYEKRKEFMDPIKRGLTLIEKYHEIATAAGDKCTGNIFILKNFGWKDKTEVVSTNYNYDSKELTADEMKKYNENLENKY